MDPVIIDSERLLSSPWSSIGPRGERAPESIIMAYFDRSPVDPSGPVPIQGADRTLLLFSLVVWGVPRGASRTALLCSLAGLKRGAFRGVLGASPRLYLILLQHLFPPYGE